MNPSRRRRRALLLAAGLAIVAGALVAAAPPGIFTIDENNYLATVVGLRNGNLALPGTEGLTPSAELFWFDPWPAGRGEPKVPVVSTAPPLYAPVALPFSALLGFRGLFAINALSFVLAALVVFLWARREASVPQTPYLALAAFVLGSPVLGYAMGAWPQMLSLALCTGAASLSARVRGGAPAAFALAAGALVGVALGVRYQNAVYALALAVTLVVWAPARLRAVALFCLGVLGPLALAAAFNDARLDSWNPISKGTHYATPTVGGLGENPIVEALWLLWARVVDFSAHPAIRGSATTWGWEPDALGAFLWLGGLKKAWLQSSPWLLVALLALVVAWVPPWPLTDSARRALKPLGVPIAAVLGMFAIAGFARHDGLAYNQRYLLELTPLAAIALALAFERFALPRTPMLVGGALGLLAAAFVLSHAPGSFPRTTGLLQAPLLLGPVFVLAWTLSSFGEARRAILGGTLAFAVAWALAVHLGDDLPPERKLRAYNAQRTARLIEAVPPHSALFAYGGSRDAAGPLLLERDVVVADPLLDGGASAPRLASELAHQGRRIFVDVARMPEARFRELAEGRTSRIVLNGDEPILELTSGR